MIQRSNDANKEPPGYTAAAPPREKWEPELRRWYDTLHKLGDIGISDVSVFYVYSEDFMENPEGVTKALMRWIKK